MGYPKGAGAGRNGKNFATVAQYFALGKAHRGGNCYGRGREPGVQGAGGGKFRPPCPPPINKVQRARISFILKHINSNPHLPPHVLTLGTCMCHRAAFERAQLKG